VRVTAEAASLEWTDVSGDFFTQQQMKKPMLLLAAVQLLASCSSEQAYSAGQNWQRNQCARIPDRAEYDRCMVDASRSYDTYKRETEPKR